MIYYVGRPAQPGKPINRILCVVYIKELNAFSADMRNGSYLFECRSLENIFQDEFVMNLLAK